MKKSIRASAAKANAAGCKIGGAPGVVCNLLLKRPTTNIGNAPYPCGQDFLDIQDRYSYSSTMQKQCLIN